MNIVVTASTLLVLLSPLSSAALTKVTCTTSGIGTCINPYCNVTAAGIANAGCGNMSRPLYEIFFGQKYSVNVLILSLPLTFPDLEFCSITKNVGQTNQFPLFSILLKAIEDQTPGFVHACPYQGTDLQVKNLSFASIEKYLGLLVTEYVITFRTYDRIDNNIFTATFYGDTRKNANGGLLGGLGINLK